MKFIWIFILMGIVATACICHADPLVWDTPYGQINLNLQSSESVIGYDAVLKQAIGGIAIPFYTDPKGFVTLHLGAGAPWPVGNQPTIQPIVMAGHNLLKEISTNPALTNIQINVFGRYSSAQGKAGVGLAFSYAFASPTPQTLQSPPPPPLPVVSAPVPVITPPTPAVIPSTETYSVPSEPVLIPSGEAQQ